MLIGTKQQGVTLLELLITIVVLTIVATIGVPGLFDHMDKRRIDGAAHTFLSDVQYARAEALKQSETIYIEVDTADWCYGITDSASAATCDCSAGTGCTVNGVDHYTSSDSFPNVTFASSLAGSTITFDPVRGTIGPSGSLFFSSTKGTSALRVILSPLGRAKLCATSGSSWGYNEC
ncbi:GspH/FimT family pseudopilin [uncultured Neptuniibacter sp.]|uniref:GspH/FimT family pseudopilin n=1 Tax=uncultured Neptuniibacter sp. TaxID=502143 RepID=UPI002618AE25|nr:GspH/FimT family pseudopilin [uncultured Neptuniibacter sp.]